MEKELSDFINQVKQGRHAMIMKPNYVVLSRSIYNAWAERLVKLEKKDLAEHIDDDLIDGEAEKDRDYEEQLRKDGDWPK